MKKMSAWQPIKKKYFNITIYSEGFFPRLGMQVFLYKWAVDFNIQFFNFDIYITFGHIND